MPGSCVAETKNVHVIYPTPNNVEHHLPAGQGGTAQLGPFNFQANSYQTFTVGLNFSGTKIPKDWSVTAWGENGNVFVYNADSSATDNFGRSPSMQKLGPQKKPAKWEEKGKKPLDMAKQPKPQKLTEVKNPTTPIVPVQHPEKKFAKFAEIVMWILSI